jgi:DNA repair exonuclease SbcCD ATPase subunit
MYISRLKLVNFEGIRQGLDKREVEINFDVEKKITMLSGGNGSGKSTILASSNLIKNHLMIEKI